MTERRTGTGGHDGGVITISVESDEEQWAIGTALVNGAIGFGSWPVSVRREWRGYGGASGQGAVIAPGGGGAVAAGGGGSSAVSAGAGCGGGGAGPVSMAVPLRNCCATYLATAHRDGCEQAGQP